MVTQTSIESYERNVTLGINGMQQQLILQMMEPGQDYSRTELEEMTGIRICSVSGQVNWMLKHGVLEISDQRRCKVTGRNINPVRLAAT